jgi:hypothetical protein
MSYQRSAISYQRNKQTESVPDKNWLGGFLAVRPKIWLFAEG